MKLRRTAALAGLGLLIALAGPNVALAAGGSVRVGTQTEAWYVTTTSETCSQVDCSLLPTPTYPKDTLHVGISGGTPTTATYIELDLFSANVPFDATLTEGTLILPVDTAAGDGSLRPEQATLRVCQVTDFFPAAKASPREPPETDCTLSAPGEYAAEPAPTFHVDLAPFLPGWSAGEAAALAIMPAPEAEKNDETWHVAFYGKDYTSGQEAGAAEASRQGAPAASVEHDSPLPTEPADNSEPGAQRNAQPLAEGAQGPQPITARLAYDIVEDDEPTLSPLPPSGLASPPIVPGAPPVNSFDAPPPVAPEITPGLAAPAGEPPQVQTEPPPTPVAAPSSIRIPYPYPIVWTVPLLLLVGIGMTGHSLTRNLERPRSSLA